MTIAKSQIVNRKVGGSLMPSGLTDNLNMDQQYDLFRFLSELGKPGPFDASSGNVARYWKIAAFDKDAAASSNLGLTGDRWHVVPSLVDGTVSRDDIEKDIPNGTVSILAGARFRTAKAGPVHFNFPPDGKGWIDGVEMTAQSTNVVSELAAGAHVVILKFEAGKVPASIRLQSADVTFLTN